MAGLTPAEDRPEIAFFDVETTIPFRPGQRFEILEFGAILVCPKKLVELRSYSALVRPPCLSDITPRSIECNGITREDVKSKPPFAAIADNVYDILHGRIWAGHNILRFDIPRIREAFAEIGREPPQAKGTIDSLVLLTKKFGRRAGDMKMASLAAYFGLGNQTHRSLDDVRMNFEVLKYCATVLLLESSLPDELTETSVTTTTPETNSRRRRNIKTSPPQSPVDQQTQENAILSFVSPVEPQPDPFDLSAIRKMIAPELLNPYTLEGTDALDFLYPPEISIPSIKAVQVPLYQGSQRTKLQLFHGDRLLQLYCPHLKVVYGFNGKFLDSAGRRKMNFVIELSSELCDVLQECDRAAKTMSADSGSGSEWNSVIIPTRGSLDPHTARIHIPAELNGDVERYATEVHQREFSEGATIQKLVSSKPSAEELESFVNRRNIVGAYLSLEAYDYQQRAGIRLVAKKLIIYKNTLIKFTGDGE
ncbi:unnamed protein product [Thlaspi arvense]|uniref:Exonuclease domain-containing protein n=1 Tax=Thlaspi arvense TaxID=13288 RepID=A0AAU9RJL0_THLAR|nr:unnamed protein product [Thlaspi arvense]